MALSSLKNTMCYKKCLILLLFLSIGCIEAQSDDDIKTQDFERLKLEVNRLGDLAEKQDEIIQMMQAKFEIQEARLTKQEAIIQELREKLQETKQQREAKEDLTTKQMSADKNTTESVTSEDNRKLAIESINEHSSIRRVLKRQNPDDVAFFAVIERAEENIGIHQNILFETVVTNVGNGYNNHHGIFIAPVSGLYLITTNILSKYDEEYWAAVVVNNVPIARLNGHGSQGRHAMGAQTVIIFLKKGDDVAIQNFNHIDSFWGDKYSSFGGILIREYETDPTIVG